MHRHSWLSVVLDSRERQKITRGVALVLACFVTLVGQANAQSVAPPLTQYTIDQNGVDLITGALHINSPSISVGQPSLGGLSYQREYDSSVYDWRDNVTGTINLD